MTPPEIRELARKHCATFCSAQSNLRDAIESAIKEALAMRPKADNGLAANLRLIAERQRLKSNSVYAAGLMDESARNRIAAESDLLDEAARCLELDDQTIYVPVSLFDERIAAMQTKLDYAEEQLRLVQAQQ